MKSLLERSGSTTARYIDFAGCRVLVDRQDLQVILTADTEGLAEAAIKRLSNLERNHVGVYRESLSYRTDASSISDTHRCSSTLSRSRMARART